jgi:hypothetical protein
METTNTINTAYRTLDQLNTDEKLYAFDRIRRSPVWNNYLRDKLDEKMFEELDSSGLYDSLVTNIKASRYSFIEACNYGGEVPVLLEAEVVATDEFEKEDIIRLIYDMDLDKVYKIKAGNICAIKFGVYASTVSAELSYYNEDAAHPSADLDAEQFQNDIEVYFSAAFSVMETILTLYSKSLRSDEEVEKWVNKNCGRFDADLRLHFVFEEV